jgi:hypothetical protein
MSNTEETARPESWEALTQWAASRTDSPAADCILELRTRVERLEQAQQPEPEPADEQTLHTVALRMVDGLERLDVLPEIQDTIRQAIREPMAQPAPSTPAGQGELVRSVAEAIAAASLGDWTPEARRAILAVTDWLVRFESIGAASALRREVR